MQIRTNIIEFKVGYHVFLKMKAKRISLKLGSYTKIAKRYYGPFKSLDKVVLIAYMLTLTTSTCIHNVFHVSLL